MFRDGATGIYRGSANGCVLIDVFLEMAGPLVFETDEFESRIMADARTESSASLKIWRKKGGKKVWLGVYDCLAKHIPYSDEGNLSYLKVLAFSAGEFPTGSWSAESDHSYTYGIREHVPMPLAFPSEQNTWFSGLTHRLAQLASERYKDEQPSFSLTKDQRPEPNRR